MIGCSIIAVALVIERFLSLRTHKVLPPQLLTDALAATPHLRPASEWVERMAQQSVLGSVLAAGLHTLRQHPHTSPGELQAAFEGAGRLAAAHLQRYLGALATIASAAPLLGLLGTVIGMIEIFAAQGSADGIGAGGNPQQLAQGISIALYNTAFGLLVAIPSLVFWRYFRARADHLLLGLEVATAQFNRHLNSLRTAAVANGSRT